MSNEIGDDVLDLCELWKRYQELLDEVQDSNPDAETTDGDLDKAFDDGVDVEEYQQLRDLFAVVGEPNRHGEFDNPTLIEDSYFEEYAMQYAEDTGAVENFDRWPMTCIDWEQAASELQSDYSVIDIGDWTYWQES